MKHLSLLVLFGAASGITAHTPADRSITNELEHIRNVNHIFNAVRGAMRQWDSSWNHNGMTFFKATVPEAIQLCHGTHTDKAVKGIEWLAFEPEHALGFARPRMRPPPGEEPPHDAQGELEEYDWEEQRHRAHYSGGSFSFDEQNKRRHQRPPSLHPPQHPEPPIDRPRHHPPPPPPPGCHHHDCRWSDGHIPPPQSPPSHHRGQPDEPRYDDDEPNLRSLHPSAKGDRQRTINMGRPAPPGPPRDDPDDGRGYLHFYKTKHPLNLLLIDGMSAGKTGRGTQDSQDYALLLGESLGGEPVDRGHPLPFMDGYRAEAMCNMTRDDWENRVDGFIRMEGGFEIILCDFEAHLELIRAQEVVREGTGHGPGNQNSFRFYQAIADRFHGIGGRRVQIDFANMVSAFSYNIDLFVNNPVIPGSMMPRLHHVSQKNLKMLQSDVTNMVLNSQPLSSIDWQAVADMVVQHFARPLQQLLSLDSTVGVDFKTALAVLLEPSISDGTKNIDVIVQRCVEQFVPFSYQDTQAGRVVHNITHHICFTLATTLDSISKSDGDIFQNNESNAIARAQSTITDLVSYLAWPIWKECNPSCASNEVCVLPIWPITSKIEDRKQPKCKNATRFADDKGPGGPGGRGGKNYWYGGD